MTTAIAALPFFGGELSAFNPSDSSVTESTTSGTYNSSYSRCGIVCNDLHSTAASPTWPVASPFWFHGAVNFTARSGPGAPNAPCIVFYSAGTIVAELYVTLPAGYYWTKVDLKTLQSGAMTTVASGYVYAEQGVVQDVDVSLTSGASATAALYLSGSLVGAGSGLNHSAWPSAGITSMAITASDDGTYGFVTQSYWSQIICDTTCTIGRSVITDNFSNESATNTGWSTYGGGTKLTNINEIVLDDGAGITSTVSGQVDTFYQSGLGYGTYNILARGASARAGYAATSPTQVKLTIRVSSTNYVGPAVALATYLQATYNSWTANPATSAAWTASAAASIEAGVTSLT